MDGKEEEWTDKEKCLWLTEKRGIKRDDEVRKEEWVEKEEDG